MREATLNGEREAYPNDSRGGRQRSFGSIKSIYSSTIPSCIAERSLLREDRSIFDTRDVARAVLPSRIGSGGGASYLILVLKFQWR